MAHRVKDSALSLMQLRLLWWCEFDPQPGNFHILWVQPKLKKKKKKKEKRKKGLIPASLFQMLLFH